MYLTERHIIKNSKELDEICFKSKNLYNRALCLIRQHYFETKNYLNWVGKRIKRGLFKSFNNKLINADLNGSFNILRKVIGEFQYPIEVCSTPLKIAI